MVNRRYHNSRTEGITRAPGRLNIQSLNICGTNAVGFYTQEPQTFMAVNVKTPKNLKQIVIFPANTRQLFYSEMITCFVLKRHH